MTDLKPIRVADVMKHKFDTVDRMSTIREALDKMRYIETKCLIVNKSHDEDEVGMLLLSDIARHVLARDRSPHRTNVYEIMCKPVLTVDPRMDVRDCARLFNRFDISRAPVVENRNAIGVVSFTDLVRKGFYQMGEYD